MMTLTPRPDDSFLGPDVVVEGIVKGQGNLHVAGRIKGKVVVAGDVTIEAGAFIDGEVQAGSLTVAPGARMRGTVEFGWRHDAA
jgi:cytoskeletal protein CcmA (bactofilin family)